MALLEEFIRDKKFDSRVVEKNISRGTVTPDEADKFRKKLPDEASHADWINLEKLEDEKKSTLPSNGAGVPGTAL